MDDDRTVIASGNDEIVKGTRLNDTYEIDLKIASGGMGDVFRGHNIETGDPVAIKVVQRRLLGDQTVIALFRKEARILAHVSHPAIVRYHVFTTDRELGRPYLAMEFVDGPSLADVLALGPITSAKARSIIGRIAFGLDAAHEAGVIHRDLSPSNIVLANGNGHDAKLIDFGIAKSSSEIGGNTVLGGRFAGKYNFVAPEQLGLFGGEVSARTDIYSLGLILAMALRGTAIDMAGTHFIDVVEKRRKVPDLQGIDETLRPLIEAMLQPDPQDRPSNLGEIAEFLAPRSYRDRDSSSFPGLAAPWTPPSPAKPAPEDGRSSSWPAARPPQPSLPYAMQTASESPQDRSQSFPPPAATAPPPSHVEGDGETAKPRRLLPLALAAVLLVGILSAGGYFVWMQPQNPVRSDEPPVRTGPTLRPANPPAPASGKTASGDPVRPQPGATATSTPPATPPTGSQAPVGLPRTEIPPPELPVSPAGETAPIDRIATMLAFVRDYALPECAYARALAATETTLKVEGFATEAAPFESMLTDARTRIGIEPDIQMRPISKAQCPAVDFMRSVKSTGAGSDLILSEDLLAAGQPLRGRLTSIRNRTVFIYLIDNHGTIYDLTSQLKRTGNEATFAFSLQSAEKQGVAPQLILALAADEPPKALARSGPVSAARLLPALRAEIDRGGGPSLDATLKYFRLGG